MLAGAEGYGGRSGDREFWDDQGRRNLAALLHAAALAGNLTMGDVQTWLSDLEGNAAQIIGLLRNRSPEPAFEALGQPVHQDQRAHPLLASPRPSPRRWPG